MSNAVKVTSTEDLRQALSAGHKPEQIELVHPFTQASIDAARAEGHAAGMKEGQAAATASALESERKRITKIQSLTRAGFEKESQAAIDGGHSPEQFALAQLEASADRGVALGPIRSDAPKPAPRSNAPHTDKTDGAKPWDEIAKTATATQRM